jgi:hypothetical protein
MYLRELNDNPKLVKLIAAIDQLRDGLEQGQITSNWSLDALLTYFRKFDIILSPDDLYSMIQTKPLNTVVDNIQGPEVIFKGLEQNKKPTEVPPSEKNSEIVDKMAKKAMK